VGYQAERRRWRVRLRDQHDRICGAGTMLDEEYLLTCAHVVEQAGGPEAGLSADFVGLPDTPVGIAKVVAGGWVPAGPDERGDVALLRLAAPQPGVFPAPLHRMPLPDNLPVRAYGFPPGADAGLWFRGTLTGEGGPGGEWIQLARRPDSHPIDIGYSGTAVLDEPGDRVVGMMVGRYLADGDFASWMIPVETVLGYLGGLRDWGEGSPAIDPTFSTVGSAPHGANYDLLFARKLADWLRDKANSAGPAVWVLVTGEPGSARAVALDVGVVLGDRERAAAAGSLRDTVPEGTVPPSGSVDLAVDAAGKSVDEVRRRLAERLALTPDHGGPVSPSVRTVVVTAIDDAVEPDRLVGEVIAPLADRAGQLGLRLALGFRRESSPGFSTLRSLSAGVVPPGGLASRISLLDKAVAELAALEEHAVTVSARFDGEPEPPARSPRRRGLVNQLRTAADEGDVEWAGRHVGEVEQRVAADLTAGNAAKARLDDLIEQRTALRFRLDSYSDKARKLGLVEDQLLDVLYAKAWQLLYEGRCDLVAAAAAVEEYGDAICGRDEGEPA
jgi:hypothetical protein